MAEEAKAEEGAEAPKSGGKKKLIIIIVAVVVLLGGVGAFFAMGGGKSEEGEGEEAASEEHGEEVEGEGELPGAIVPLDTFIVNLQVKGSFLKTTVQLELATPQPSHDMENQIPKIRDVIIKVLSSKGSVEILSVEGKEKLREEIKNGVNEILGAEDVVQVYFTEFIVQ